MVCVKSVLASPPPPCPASSPLPASSPSTFLHHPGIIIDTFADLRTVQQSKHEDMKTVCFICNIPRCVDGRNRSGIAKLPLLLPLLLPLPLLHPLSNASSLLFIVNLPCFCPSRRNTFTEYAGPRLTRRARGALLLTLSLTLL
jgi:hypothetical protein